MSKSFYLLTAFGKDRPGMVAQVTRLVFQLKGSIEDASMTRLGGEFTMMLVISLPKRLSTLPRISGLTLSVKPIAAGLGRQKQTQATHMISVYGTDRPGIVYKTTDVLARQRVNITDLNTRVLKRGGKMLYVMLVEVQIGSPAKARTLQKTLQRLGRSLRLDVTLHEIGSIAL
jgi:glycine cleavage system transcriptional repressor